MVAPTVIMTGRIRSIPASGRARSRGSPFSCSSSMKSKSTMTWLTITPMRLATKECHEAEGRTHDRQSDQRSHRSVRCGRKDKQGLYGILELHEQSQVDADERDQENDGQIDESIDLLCFLAGDL